MPYYYPKAPTDITILLQDIDSDIQFTCKGQKYEFPLGLGFISRANFERVIYTEVGEYCGSYMCLMMVFICKC